MPDDLTLKLHNILEAYLIPDAFDEVFTPESFQAITDYLLENKIKYTTTCIEEPDIFHWYAVIAYENLCGNIKILTWEVEEKC